MQKLTRQGEQKLNELALRYGVSTEATINLLQALVNGNGTMAQFNHPDLGGSGQWMQGGMTMVSDMFNNALKATVDGLCSELSTLLADQPFRNSPSQPKGTQQQQQGNGPVQVSLFVPESNGSFGNWWPADLGVPSSTGSQNHVRYAVFSNAQRLVVEINGKIQIYDTLDYQIGGVSQQQGAGTSVTFTSQKGFVDVSQLPVVSENGVAAGTPDPHPPPPQSPKEAPPTSNIVDVSPKSDIAEAPPELGNGEPSPELGNREPSPKLGNGEPSPGLDIFTMIQKLADLHEKGILTDAEFTEKKSELLGRL